MAAAPFPPPFPVSIVTMMMMSPMFPVLFLLGVWAMPVAWTRLVTGWGGDAVVLLSWFFWSGFVGVVVAVLLRVHHKGAI